LYSEAFILTTTKEYHVQFITEHVQITETRLEKHTCWKEKEIICVERIDGKVENGNE